MSLTINNNSLTLNISGIERAIDVDQICTLSQTTGEIFTKFKKIVPNCFHYPFQSKAKTLAQTLGKMEHAQAQATRNKILAALRTVLTVAIVVGGVLGTMAMVWNPPIAVLIGFGAFAAYLGIGYYNTHKAGLMDISCAPYAGLLFTLATAPFMPIYEICSKIPHKKKQTFQQKEELSKNFSDLVCFFKQDHSHLLAMLDQELVKARQAFETLKENQLLCEYQKKRIQDLVVHCEKAVQEFIQTQAYYSQF